MSESTLTNRINAVRKAVGDSGLSQKLVRTIPRKGLRFIGLVHTQSDDGKLAQAADHPPDQFHGPSRPVLPLPDRPAIASHLEHERRSGTGVFSDGISEDIITALSKLRWLFVIARISVTDFAIWTLRF